MLQLKIHTYMNTDLFNFIYLNFLTICRFSFSHKSILLTCENKEPAKNDGDSNQPKKKSVIGADFWFLRCRVGGEELHMFGQEAFPGHLLLSLHPDSLADNPDQPFILVRSMVRRGLWRRLPGRFFLWRGPFWVGGWLAPPRPSPAA